MSNRVNKKLRKKDNASKKRGAENLSKNLQFNLSTKRREISKQQIVQLTPSEDTVSLFQHLPSFQVPDSLTEKIRFGDKIHPAVLRVGLKFHKMKLTGANSRCIALLEAFVYLLEDCACPPDLQLFEHLFALVNTQIQFIIDCRPMSVGMRNAVKQFKIAIRKTRNMEEDEIIDYLIDFLRSYINRKIYTAGAVINELCLQKINNGDVILTFGSSSTVENVLKHAYSQGRDISVVIVDSNPRYEGKILLKKLNERGIDCTYCLLSGVSYVMAEVNKVILGTDAMLSNGAAMGRVGTALVAMMANSQHIPVLFVCETYKFQEKVQLDSICFNELGDSNEILNDEGAPKETISQLKKLKNLKTLNLEIDVTPCAYISAVVTELGMIPPTSVPAVLRGQRDHQDFY